MRHDIYIYLSIYIYLCKYIYIYVCNIIYVHIYYICDGLHIIPMEKAYSHHFPFTKILQFLLVQIFLC